MPLRRTEKLQVERRILGSGCPEPGRSERFVGKLPEDRKQENHRSDASRHDRLMISFEEHPLVRHQHAPALQAASEMDSASCIDSTMTLTSGNLDFMIEVASMPLRTGIVTSISTTSGLCFPTAWIAACPSSASPTTCKSGSFPSKLHIVPRYTRAIVDNNNTNRCSCHKDPSPKETRINNNLPLITIEIYGVKTVFVRQGETGRGTIPKIDTEGRL